MGNESRETTGEFEISDYVFEKFHRDGYHIASVLAPIFGFLMVAFGIYIRELIVVGFGVFMIFLTAISIKKSKHIDSVYVIGENGVILQSKNPDNTKVFTWEEIYSVEKLEMRVGRYGITYYYQITNSSEYKEYMSAWSNVNQKNVICIPRTEQTRAILEYYQPKMTNCKNFILD